jgi:hypothetical protein
MKASHHEFLQRMCETVNRCAQCSSKPLLKLFDDVSLGEPLCPSCQNRRHELLIKVLRYNLPKVAPPPQSGGQCGHDRSHPLGSDHGPRHDAG